VAIEKKGQYYTTLGLDELAEQFSGMLKKKFNSYKIAGKHLKKFLIQNAGERKVVRSSQFEIRLFEK
jgi:hypothetical protein